MEANDRGELHQLLDNGVQRFKDLVVHSLSSCSELRHHERAVLLRKEDFGQGEGNLLETLKRGHGQLEAGLIFVAAKILEDARAEVD